MFLRFSISDMVMSNKSCLNKKAKTVITLLVLCALGFVGFFSNSFAVDLYYHELSVNISGKSASTVLLAYVETESAKKYMSMFLKYLDLHIERGRFATSARKKAFSKLRSNIQNAIDQGFGLKAYMQITSNLSSLISLKDKGDLIDANKSLLSEALFVLQGHGNTIADSIRSNLAVLLLDALERDIKEYVLPAGLKLDSINARDFNKRIDKIKGISNTQKDVLIEIIIGLQECTDLKQEVVASKSNVQRVAASMEFVIKIIEQYDLLMKFVAQY